VQTRGSPSIYLGTNRSGPQQEPKGGDARRRKCGTTAHVVQEELSRALEQVWPPASTCQPKELARTVIVIADDRSVMVVVPASHEVQISQLARALGAHAARLAEDPEFGPMFWTVSWERCRPSAISTGSTCTPTLAR
jgi:hypothetical protein